MWSHSEFPKLSKTADKPRTPKQKPLVKMSTVSVETCRSKLSFETFVQNASGLRNLLTSGHVSFHTQPMGFTDGERIRSKRAVEGKLSSKKCSLKIACSKLSLKKTIERSLKPFVENVFLETVR